MTDNNTDNITDAYVGRSRQRYDNRSLYRPPIYGLFKGPLEELYRDV
jgi:hypothetical protein